MSTVWSFKQELVGVFGHPVAENPTQVMIEAAFTEMGLDWRYLTVEVRPEDLGPAVRGAKAMNWKGFNLTIPHKVAVLDHLDRLSPAAVMIGAVNCVINQAGEWFGDNTDGKGFLQAVQEVRSIQGARVTLLGAGGAARAIGVELALAGAAHLTVVNRDVHRGQLLTKLIRDKTGVPTNFVTWEGMYPVSEGTDVVVNATSIGLYPDVEARVPIDPQTLTSDMIVCDVIPNPPRTWFIREAERKGCRVIDGLEMLVNQGVIGIRLWTGKEPSPRVMRSALESVFQP